MSPRYLRNEPSSRDNLAAALISGAVAVGVGVVAFYLVRLLVAREAIGGSGEQDSVAVERTEG